MFTRSACGFGSCFMALSIRSLVSISSNWLVWVFAGSERMCLLITCCFL